MTAVSPSPSANGTGQALDAAGLFARYGQELYRFCLGRLRNPEDAADALQNTFLRVHVALEKGTVPQFEAAWLYKIAHNVCVSRREQAGRRSAHETPSDLDELKWAMAAPEHDHDRLEGLADALADLPHNLRQSLLLREWQGLSYTEIADALDTTVPAVETLLYRARKQLATALEQGGRKARAALGGLLDLLGIRALVGRLSTVLSSAGAAKLAIGAALVAAGGSALGAAEAVSTHAAGAPAHRASRASAVHRSTPNVLASSLTRSRYSTAKALAPEAGDSAGTPAAPSSPPHATPPAPATPAGATATQTPATATIPTAPASVPALVQPPAADTPSAPATSTLPSTPTTPAAPAAPQVPSTPSLSTPSLTTPSAQAPTAPALPQLPATPTVPQTPTVPSTPSLSGLGG